MSWFRKVLFWIHLVVGLTVGLAIASMAVTGSMMAFERPIVAWAERADSAACAPPVGVKVTDKNQAWAITALVRAAMLAVPDASPSAVTAEPDIGRPLAVQFGRERVVYLNNFTGKIVSMGAPRLRSFFATVEQVHRYLALTGDWRNWGRTVSGAAALGLVFMVCSGLWLWVPRRLRW
ncbi:MAG TPA: PepSY-associated TM helix domain-containing protein, partial [Tepidisphaeraceae bacterium]|nr:PepSY-associated TM helix domain-containing protein [Tepidisphaeraceae bacterium]